MHCCHSKDALLPESKKIKRKLIRMRRDNKRPLIIAIESFALGETSLSGIGTVALNYIKQIADLDKRNKYIIFFMREQKHLKGLFPNFIFHQWRLIDRIYAAREKAKKQWEEKVDYNFLIRLYRQCTRKSIGISLVTLETAYKIWLPVCLWVYKADVYVSMSAYFYPSCFCTKLKRISFVYDLTWKRFPETMETGNRKQMEGNAEKNISKANHLVAISENTKKDIRTLMDIHTDITVIPPAADKDIFFQAEEFSIQKMRETYGINKKYVLSICTLEPRKNLKLLLQAYSRLKDPHGYELVLAGRMGWLSDDLMDYIKGLDIEKNVILTGYVPREDLAPLYSGAEVFAYPSVYEGFGMPVLEAIQCGCPVIASDSSSIPEVTGDAGILVPVNNLQALCDALERILSDSDLKERLKEKGLERAKRFSWKKSVGRFLNLYI